MFYCWLTEAGTHTDSNNMCMRYLMAKLRTAHHTPTSMDNLVVILGFSYKSKYSQPLSGLPESRRHCMFTSDTPLSEITSNTIGFISNRPSP